MNPVDTSVRPLKNSEQTADFSLDKQTLFFSGKEFTFDHVFGQTASQHKVFSAAVKPLVSSILDGFNVTILAYGQTGAGKTHTMDTAGTTDGIIPQTIKFHAQVYNDDLRDLLSPDNVSSGVQIRDRGNNQVEVTGLTTHEVTGSDEVTLHLLPPQILRFLFIGGHARKTACTHMNATSSRSHAIFTIKLKFSRVGEVNERVTSKINFVDLAGSESLKRTGAEGERAKEGININMGLLALGNVINSLSEGRVHIPYRSSKLTRLLSDSIGGNSKTLFIACISPAKEDKHETLNTLLYASRVKRIHNRAVQQITSENEVISLKAEIVWLRKQLEVFQANHTFLDFSEFNNLVQRRMELANEANRLYTLLHAKRLKLTVLRFKVSLLNFSSDNEAYEDQTPHNSDPQSVPMIGMKNKNYSGVLSFSEEAYLERSIGANDPNKEEEKPLIRL